MPTYIYLHGFASSPQSAKAKYLRDRFRSRQLDLLLPDLNQNDFTHLTLSRQIQQVSTLFSASTGSSESMVPGSISPVPVTLIGSSLGGLTAAWIAEQQPQVQRLVLLAPAFGFLHHWLPKLGTETIEHWRKTRFYPIFHYGENRELPLHYEFITDCQRYPEGNLRRSLPTLILHGIEDEVIPIQSSRDFAENRNWVQLIELETDHGLANVISQVWRHIQQFCQIQSP